MCITEGRPYIIFINIFGSQFAERNLWFVAVASKGAGNANQSITVFFGSVVEDTVTGKFVYRNSSG